MSGPTRVGHLNGGHIKYVRRKQSQPHCRRGSCAALCLRLHPPHTVPHLTCRMLNDYRWFWGSHMTLFVVYYTCLILHPLPGNPAVAHKGKVYVSERQLFMGGGGLDGREAAPISQGRMAGHALWLARSQLLRK